MLIENGADPDLPCGKVTPIIFVCLAYLSLSYMSNIFLWQGHTKRGAEAGAAQAEH